MSEVSKAILRLCGIAFWSWLVWMILRMNGNYEIFWFLFIWGLPCGIREGGVVFVLRNADIGATLGMLVLGLIIGGFAGIFLTPLYVIKTIYVLVKNLI